MSGYAPAHSTDPRPGGGLRRLPQSNRRPPAPGAINAAGPNTRFGIAPSRPNFETWLALAAGPDGTAPPAYVEQAFRRYLECGILAHGFARAHCAACGYDFLIGFSCKGRGVCPSCNTRRMVATAAHLADHVLPALPVRQWVLSVPKRLRYFLQRDAALQDVVLQLLVRAVERCLRAHSPGCSAAARLGAVAFIHRFGATLNEHPYFHCCILDGVFESAGTTAGAAGVVFHPALGLNAAAVHRVQAQVRRQVLRACVRRGLLEQGDADAMGEWDHGGGFSLDAAVRIEGADLAGRERLLRYCARPPFALAQLHEHDAEHLLHVCPKPRPGGPSALVLTPLELLDKIAALVPPPRTHRHRYYGVRAPNAPLRAAVTALAPVPVPPPLPADPAGAPVPSAHRASARCLWAMLLARIYEVLPLTCPFCQTPIRIIAFVNDASAVRQMLDRLGEPTRAPRFAPNRGPPLWEAAAESNDQAWDQTPPPAPAVDFDQRIIW